MSAIDAVRTDLGDLLERVDEGRLAELLETAVAAYSPTWAEGPAADVFERALNAAGLGAIHQPVGAPDAGRHNLIVDLGPRPASLLLVGHLDTVAWHGERPPRPHWEGERLYGLGSADMKGGCAAMVEAIARVAAAGLPLARGVRLALVVGEEEYGDGAEALVNAGPLPALTIVGEPTRLAPCTAHQGYLELELEARGRRAHAAVPGEGANAVNAMLRWLLALTEGDGEPDRPAGIAVNTRQIMGGSPLFAVPERCNANVDVHVPPGEDPEEIERGVEAAAGRARVAEPRVQLGWERVFWEAGYALDLGADPLAPLVAAHAAIGRAWAPTGFPSHSDACRLHAAGTAPVVLGPGRLEVAHAEDEHVDLGEVVTAARLYAALIAIACGA